MPTATSARGALSLIDVSKSYVVRGDRTLAVDRCSLDIAPGEIFMVVGPSGCGKTSLLNAVAGFHGIDQGTIRLDGTTLCGPGRNHGVPGPDRIVVFQEGALFPWKTAIENIAFGALVQGRLRRREALDKAAVLLAEAGLRGHEHDYPAALSSGAQRRVEIARALMNGPAVLLFDEPYRALDRATRSVLHEALLEVHGRTRVTILFITHDLEEAVFLGHRVAVMTARPCRPKRIVPVDLPSPRDHTLLATAQFRDILRRVSEPALEEAAIAFRQNDAEGALAVTA